MHLDIEGQEEARTLAEIMVRSVRKAMPSAGIVQLTDQHTPDVSGVDIVIRRPMLAPWLMLYRLDHFRNFPEGDTMFIDTDAVVQHDVRGVFDRPFDVALTRRTGPIMVNGKDIVPEMPFNTGVMFSRGSAFWKDCFAYCSTLADHLKHWFGDQMAVRVVSESGKHSVLQLRCDEFNYSPEKFGDDVSEKYVVHYKGPIRKKWMLNKFSTETA